MAVPDDNSFPLDSQLGKILPGIPVRSVRTTLFNISLL